MDEKSYKLVYMEEVDLQSAVRQMENHGGLGAEPKLQHWKTGHFVSISSLHQLSGLDQMLVHVGTKVVE